MNTVIIVNLNGNAFHLEAPGFESLRLYLENARSQLKGNPDRAEIMSDLEQAIADKCSHYLRPHKNVLTSAEVGAILEQMGPVQAEHGETARPETSAEGGAARGAGSAPPPGSAPRRLHQIREGAMISGVCTGLASYFNVDVTLVRIVFVAAALLTGGLWILAYVAMMLVVPFANTGEEFAAASGAPFNAQQVIDRAKKHYAQFKDGTEWRQHWRAQRRAWRRQWYDRAYWWRHNLQRNVYQFSAQGGGYIGHVFAGLMIPLLAIIGALLVGAFLTTVVVYATTGSLFGYPLFAGVPLWAGLMLLSLAYVVFASPLHFMRRAIYAQPGAGGVVYFGVLDSFFSIGMLAVLGWLAYHHLPQVRDFFEHFSQNITLIWNNLANSAHSAAAPADPLPAGAASAASAAPGIE